MTDIEKSTSPREKLVARRRTRVASLQKVLPSGASISPSSTQLAAIGATLRSVPGNWRSTTPSPEH